jgi:hypothetical protein
LGGKSGNREPPDEIEKVGTSNACSIFLSGKVKSGNGGNFNSLEFNIIMVGNVWKTALVTPFPPTRNW